MENKTTDNKKILSRTAIRYIIDTNKLHRQLAEKRAYAVTLPPSQHRMLMMLAKRDITPSQKEIAEHFNITPAAVAVTMKKLESAGFITRDKMGCEDARYNKIYVTEKGIVEMQTTHEYFDYIDERMFCDFNESEISTLIDLMSRARANLQKIQKES